MTETPLPAATVEERAAALDAAIVRAAMGGGRVVTRTQDRAVIAYKKRPTHLLHLILTLVTCLWAIVWIVLSVKTPPETTRTLMVDEWARTWVLTRNGWQAF